MAAFRHRADTRQEAGVRVRPARMITERTGLHAVASSMPSTTPAIIDSVSVFIRSGRLSVMTAMLPFSV